MTKYGMKHHTIKYFQDQGRDLNRMTGYPTIEVPGLCEAINSAARTRSARDLAHYVISLMSASPRKTREAFATIGTSQRKVKISCLAADGKGSRGVIEVREAFIDGDAYWTDLGYFSDQCLEYWLCVGTYVPEVSK